MRDELVKAIRATKGLTTDELAQLRNHISALVSLGPSAADGISSESNHNDWVLQGLVDYCRREGMEGAFISVLTTGRAGYDTWRQKRTDVEKYLKKAGPVVKRLALLNLGLELLKEDIQGRSTKDKRVMSAKKLMSEMHRLPGVINKQFPGYHAAGLLHMIIRSDNNYVWKKRRERAVQSDRKASSGKGTVLHNTR